MSLKPKPILFGWLILWITWPLFAQTLTDRLLFEVDLRSYTQSQMELYLVCKDTLSGQPQPRIVNATEWDKLLEEFKNDMVIYQEAVRLGSFEASSRMMDRALELFATRRQGLPIISTMIKKLSTDERLIKRTVAIAVSVESFRRSKERQAAVVQQKSESSKVRDTALPDWQKDLVSRSVVRFFDGASTFQSIKFL